MEQESWSQIRGKRGAQVSKGRHPHRLKNNLPVSSQWSCTEINKLSKERGSLLGRVKEMLYSRGRAVKVWKLEMHKYLYPKFLPKHFRSPGQIHAGSSQSHCSCSPFQLLSLRHERSVQKLASKKRRRRRMACSSPVMVIMVLRSLFTPPRLTSAPFCVKLFSCRSPMTLVLLHSKPTLLSSTN